MSSPLQTSTLTDFVAALKKNFDLLPTSFQDLYLAAEQANDLFNQLFTERVVVQKGELWEHETQKMLFGTYLSWVQGFVMTAAGLADLGLVAVRRAIEFTCYISKIKNSNERADLWLSRNQDRETRKKFNGVFGIPRSYFEDNYAHLRHLLVWHDLASDFGAHGNFAALVTKTKDSKNSPALVMSFQDDPSKVPLYTGTTLLMGFLIMEAILIDLRQLTKDPDEFRKRVETFKEMLRKARIEVAQYEFGGNVSVEILKSINSGDVSGLHSYYEELKRAYLV
jgi:hypothetical protein